jgi:hypothetical protein
VVRGAHVRMCACVHVRVGVVVVVVMVVVVVVRVYGGWVGRSGEGGRDGVLHAHSEPSTPCSQQTQTQRARRGTHPRTCHDAPHVVPHVREVQVDVRDREVHVKV